MTSYVSDLSLWNEIKTVQTLKHLTSVLMTATENCDFKSPQQKSSHDTSHIEQV